jgi:hypothetical protein
MFASLDVLCTKLAQEHNYQYEDASCCQQKRWDKEESPKPKEAPTFSTSLARLKPVTFRKGVTPWLPFRRLESMVAPDWIPGLLVAC